MCLIPRNAPNEAEHFFSFRLKHACNANTWKIFLLPLFNGWEWSRVKKNWINQKFSPLHFFVLAHILPLFAVNGKAHLSPGWSAVHNNNSMMLHVNCRLYVVNNRLRIWNIHLELGIFFFKKDSTECFVTDHTVPVSVFYFLFCHILVIRIQFKR